MRESRFIRKHKNTWRELELRTVSASRDPLAWRDALSETTDHLSYARTHYRQRSIKHYLNNLATRLYEPLLRTRAPWRERFRSFWLDEIPLMCYQARHSMAIAAGILLLAVLIGMLSSAKYPEFPELIFGADYVQKTKALIAAGDPLGIYKSSDPGSMFFTIAVNNLKVVALIYVMGAFLAFGTVMILLSNGIMLGTFMYFFYSRGLAWEFNLTVWLHGTLEILGMVLAGSAGLSLGSGLLFPGTMSRRRSFYIAARRSIRLMMGCVPIILLAAWLEAFITRYGDMSALLRFSIIAGSFCGMIGYFVWIPWNRFHNSTANTTKEPVPEQSGFLEPDLQRIHSPGSMLFQSMLMLRRLATGFLSMAFLAAVLLYAVIRWSLGSSFGILLYTHPESGFALGTFPQLLLPSLLWLSGLITAFSISCRSWFQIQEPAFSFALRRCGIIALPISIALLLLHAEAWTTLLFLVPLLLLWMCLGIWITRGRPLQAFTLLIRYAGSLPRTFSVYLLLLGLLFFAYIIPLSPLAETIAGWMSWHASINVELSLWMFGVFYYFVLSLLAGLMLLSFSFLAFTLREIHEAPALLNEIRNMKPRRTIHGFEAE